MNRTSAKNSASKSSLAEIDGEVIVNCSGTAENDELADFVSSAKRKRPSKRVYIYQSDDDGDEEVVILD